MSDWFSNDTNNSEDSGLEVKQLIYNYFAKIIILILFLLFSNLIIRLLIA